MENSMHVKKLIIQKCKIKRKNYLPMNVILWEKWIINILLDILIDTKIKHYVKYI